MNNNFGIHKLPSQICRQVEILKRTKGKLPYNKRDRQVKSFYHVDISKLKGFVPMDYHKTREQFVAEQKAKLDIDNLLALSNKRMVNCKGELFKN